MFNIDWNKKHKNLSVNIINFNLNYNHVLSQLKFKNFGHILKTLSEVTLLNNTTCNTPRYKKKFPEVKPTEAWC